MRKLLSLRNTFSRKNIKVWIVRIHIVLRIKSPVINYSLLLSFFFFSIYNIKQVWSYSELLLLNNRHWRLKIWNLSRCSFYLSYHGFIRIRGFWHLKIKIWHYFWILERLSLKFLQFLKWIALFANQFILLPCRSTRLWTSFLRSLGPLRSTILGHRASILKLYSCHLKLMKLDLMWQCFTDVNSTYHSLHFFNEERIRL